MPQPTNHAIRNGFNADYDTLKFLDHIMPTVDNQNDNNITNAITSNRRSNRTSQVSHVASHGKN
jgi:hypothetical protein